VNVVEQYTDRKKCAVEKRMLRG